jgi:membrane protease YdiL (CAAX protease family)
VSPADHLFALVLVIVLPVYAGRVAPQLVHKLDTGLAGALLHEYRITIAIQWALTLALVASWPWQERALADLGLQWPPTTVGRWVTLVAAGATTIFFVRQARVVARSASARAQVRQQLARQATVQALIPRSPEEIRAFRAAAVTAGICEEVLYRGFGWWYASAALGSGVLAFVAASVAFGLAHAYQGPRGIVMTGLVGAAALGVYVATGSLVAPIVMHAVIDLTNGAMASHALATAGDVPTRDSAA